MQIVKSVSSRKYAILSVLFVLFIAYYPQVSLIASRGSSWNGTFFVTNYDETAYAAYVNALLGGKPRKTDPFTGVDEASYESFYSIQFIPAFAIALPARTLGLSTSTAFIFLDGLIAIATALALFWLIKTVNNNDLLAVAGTIFVLAFGIAAAFEGELRHLVHGNVAIEYFPFLRRYQPGLAFPIFIFYLGAVWKVISAVDLRKALLWAAGAGCSIVILVFSYFFLWTSALAFFVVMALLAIALLPDRRRNISTASSVVVLTTIAALVPYYFLLADRSREIDSVQLLDETHSPELFSLPIVIGLAIVIAAVVLARKNYIRLDSPMTIFTIAIALTPLVLLNQQIVTGLSLQPIHFEVFVANYMSLIAVVMLIGALVRSEKSIAAPFVLRKALAYLAVVSAAWGTVEAVTDVNRNKFAAEVRDRAMSAIRLAEKDSAEAGNVMVLTPDMVTGDFIQSVSRMRPLWSPHTSSGGGVSLAENKRLFYRYLYLNGITDRELADALHARVFEVTAAIFGSDQALPVLGGNSQKITDGAIQAEASKYKEFISSADKQGVYEPTLNYIVVASEAEPDYSRLDRWYRRELIGESGGFRVYRLSVQHSIAG